MLKSIIKKIKKHNILETFDKFKLKAISQNKGPVFLKKCEDQDTQRRHRGLLHIKEVKTTHEWAGSVLRKSSREEYHWIRDEI